MSTPKPSIVWGTVTSDVPSTLVLIEEIQKSFS